jgi:hypothetical protein
MALYFDEIREGEAFRLEGDTAIYRKTGLMEYEDERGILYALPSLTLPHHKLSPSHTRVERVKR